MKTMYFSTICDFGINPKYTLNTERSFSVLLNMETGEFINADCLMHITKKSLNLAP